MSAPSRQEPEPASSPPGGAAPRRTGERTDARIAVAIAAPVFFVPPVMALADRDATLLGVPSIALYLFSAWFVGIVVTALAARARKG